MNSTRWLPVGAGTLLLTALVLSGPQTHAQIPFARPGEIDKIDEPTQRRIIDDVIAVLDSAYVMTDVAARMIEHLDTQWGEGTWRDLTDPVDFVQRLNEELHGVYDDHHLSLATLHPAPPNAEQPDADVRDPSDRAERLRKGNYGFRKVEILPGNIGYLELDQFVETELAGETAVGAMAFLANCDGLIIDLRQNGGGSASMIQLLTGYLLDEQEHLINWYQRDEDRTVQSWSQAYVPGKRITEAPVYILTSGATGSAAEEFTFDLENLGRATIVGDTTAGAGNTVQTFVMDYEAFRVGMRASYGAATDPRTGEGWEGVGVVPDIPVPQEQALDVAQMEILQTLREEAGEDDSAVDWALRDLESRLHPVTLSKKELTAFVGTYGPRRILMEDGHLYYEREGRPRQPLAPMGEDLFRVGDLGFFRIRFERGAGSEVERLVGMYDDGREDISPRSG